MKKKGKISFKQKKINAIKSINEVEHFLRKSGKISDYIKLLKIMKNNY